METSERRTDPQPSLEDRRLLLEEGKLALDSSFARKWLPTIATVTVGLIAGMFSIVQQHAANQQTERASIEARAKDQLARIETKAKDDREWGFKVVEMYFSKREMFDLTKNAEQAESNLRVLAAVAPGAVQGVLNAEKARIPPPSDVEETKRIDSLVAVAGVQAALNAADPARLATSARTSASDFTVYVQYAVGDRDFAARAQSELLKMGYHVPGIQEVGKVPSRLQVRYYRPDQKPIASELAGQLGKQLGLAAGPDSAILVTSAKQLPGGILEVWLPHGATAS
jgi:hypothetical protein